MDFNKLTVIHGTLLPRKLCRQYAVSDVPVTAGYIGSDFLPAYDHISSASETGRTESLMTVRERPISETDEPIPSIGVCSIARLINQLSGLKFIVQTRSYRKNDHRISLGIYDRRTEAYKTEFQDTYKIIETRNSVPLRLIQKETPGSGIRG